MSSSLARRASLDLLAASLFLRRLSRYESSDGLDSPSLLRLAATMALSDALLFDVDTPDLIELGDPADSFRPTGVVACGRGGFLADLGVLVPLASGDEHREAFSKASADC